MLWTKRAHQTTIFQTSECSNESSPNSSCHFWNHKARFYSNFASLFSVLKDNSSEFFLAHTSYNLDENSSSKWNLWTFECQGQNSPNSSCHAYLQPQVSFSLNIASLFNVTRDNSFVLFNWNFICFYERSPSKCKISDFRLLRWNFTKFVLSYGPFVESK